MNKLLGSIASVSLIIIIFQISRLDRSFSSKLQLYGNFFIFLSIISLLLFVGHYSKTVGKDEKKFLLSVSIVYTVFMLVSLILFDSLFYNITDRLARISSLTFYAFLVLLSGTIATFIAFMKDTD